MQVSRMIRLVLEIGKVITQIYYKYFQRNMPQLISIDKQDCTELVALEFSDRIRQGMDAKKIPFICNSI